MRSYNDEEENADGAGFTTGLLVGAALGAVIALLYAPKSGEQTRQQLKDLADQQKENLKNQWDSTKEAVTGAVDATKEKVD